MCPKFFKISQYFAFTIIYWHGENMENAALCFERESSFTCQGWCVEIKFSFPDAWVHSPAP